MVQLVVATTTVIMLLQTLRDAVAAPAAVEAGRARMLADLLSLHAACCQCMLPVLLLQLS